VTPLSYHENIPKETGYLERFKNALVTRLGERVGSVIPQSRIRGKKE